MSKKTLLLNDDFSVLSFVPERKMLKLVAKNKVEILNSWSDIIVWSSGQINHPAIIRLIKHVNRSYSKCNAFSRKAVVKRDQGICMYCGRKLSISEITIDHIIPKFLGGRTTFTNCVVSCGPCNNKKANQTLEEANMVLLCKPTHPSFSNCSFYPDAKESWHPEWDTYLGS